MEKKKGGVDIRGSFLYFFWGFRSLSRFGKAGCAQDAAGKLVGKEREARRVEVVALAIWAGTACFGLYLLGIWLSHGGLRQQATRITVFPAALIFAHPILATTGLSFWIAYVLTHRLAYAWAGFGVLSGS